MATVLGAVIQCQAEHLFTNGSAFAQALHDAEPGFVAQLQQAQSHAIISAGAVPSQQRTPEPSSARRAPAARRTSGGPGIRGVGPGSRLFGPIPEHPPARRSLQRRRVRDREWREYVHPDDSRWVMRWTVFFASVWDDASGAHPALHWASADDAWEALYLVGLDPPSESSEEEAAAEEEALGPPPHSQRELLQDQSALSNRGAGHPCAQLCGVAPRPELQHSSQCCFLRGAQCQPGTGA